MIIKKIVFALSIIASLMGLVTGCASATDPADTYQGESQEKIYSSGKEALQDKSYSEAIKRFEALDVQYPFGPYTESAQYFLVYAYYMKEEYALSVAAADRFIRLHPTYKHIDYVYYMRGVADYYQNLGILERFFSVDLATRDLTQMRKAYDDFNQVVILFPDSPYASAAHQYMIYLRNIMADHELHVAEYYYNRRAYVAATNRASDLVAHYQGAPATVDGLALMAKSYRQLNLPKQESDTLTVLKYNYPELAIDYNSDYTTVSH